MAKLKDEALGKLKELGNSILGNFGMSLDNFKMTQDPATGSWSVRYFLLFVLFDKHLTIRLLFQHEQRQVNYGPFLPFYAQNN